jgi:hypothetical protein
MKKPVSLRSNFPEESKTVTKITAGWTLFASFGKSRD